MKVFIIIKETSQRVKNKNFIKINNEVLWERTVKKFSKNFKVYIDTDSKKVFNKCKKKFPNVICYMRNNKFIEIEKKNLHNKSPVLLMIDNFIKNYVKNDNEIIITTHVTSPFIKISTIKKLLKKIKNYDSIHSVTLHKEFAWMLKNKKIKPINFNPKIVKKTQSLEPIYFSNGAFHIFKKKIFLKFQNRIGEKNLFYNLKFPENIEIDNYDDLKLARLIN
jgi:CMP-N-acetylneuraminic acid synthetase